MSYPAGVERRAAGPSLPGDLDQRLGFGWIAPQLAASLPHCWHQNAKSDRRGPQTAGMV